MNWFRIALFPGCREGEVLKKRLEQAGVTARLHKELGLARLWFVTESKAMVDLEVPEEQTEKAKELLLAWDAADGALRKAVHCPQCGSLRVDYPQYTPRTILTNLLPGILAALHVIRKQFYCRDCHFTWPKPGTRRFLRRRNSAPDYFLE